ncbi:MAG: MmgE/PrpD family protein [bacterium]|nr:MmgE/PrpD family protein [bacterium]
MTTRTTAESLAEFARDLRLEDVPCDVVDKAKTLILDSVGCAIGGQRTPFGQAAIRMAFEEEREGSLPIMGSRDKTTLPWAIYVNSYLANCLDFDDVHDVTGHPGATIVPPALTWAMAGGSSGAAVLRSVIAAYEVSIRIAEGCRSSRERSRVVAGYSTFQIFGTTVALGLLAGLSAAEMADALALTGPHATVPFVRKSGRQDRPYSWIKNNYGWAALGGYLAVNLAGQGFRGNRTLLDGDRGFWRMAGSDNCDPDRFCDGLGTQWRLTQVDVKPYPCCRHIHAALGAVRRALAEAGHPDTTDVMMIEVASDPDLIRDFLVYRPQDVVDAQFSLPYTVALLVLGVTPGYEWLDKGNWDRSELWQTADKVRGRAVETPEPERLGGRWAGCRVVLRDGSEHTAVATAPSESLDGPQVAAKFGRLAVPVLGQKALGVAEWLARVEAQANCESLIPLLGLE